MPLTGGAGGLSRNERETTAMRRLILPLLIISCPNVASRAATAPAFVTKWGSYGTAAGQFLYPLGLAVGPDGSVYVADHSASRVQKFFNDGAFALQWGSSGSGGGQFDGLMDIAVDAGGNVFTLEDANQRVQKFTSGGGYVTKWGSYGTCDGYFSGPSGIGVDGMGFVYVADDGNRRIQKFTGSGSFVTKWGSWTDPCAPGDWQDDWLYPTDVAGDLTGRVFVAAAHSVRVYSGAGDLLTVWGGPAGSGPGQFYYPHGVAADAAGQVYVADMGNNRIQILSSSGVFLTQVGSFGAGDGQFNQPTSVAVDAQGNMFVLDTGNHRIQKFSGAGPTPAIRTTFGRIKARYR